MSVNYPPQPQSEQINNLIGSNNSSDSSVPLPEITFPPYTIPYSTDHAQAPYSQYLIDTTYFTDTGMRVISTCSLDPTVLVLHSAIRVSQPITTKIIIWTVERMFLTPNIPSADTKNKNEILISKSITPANPLQHANGKVFRISGTYVYRLLKALTENDVFPAGTTPAETDSANAAGHAIVPTQFDSTILDSSYAEPKVSEVTLPVFDVVTPTQAPVIGIIPTINIPPF